MSEKETTKSPSGSTKADAGQAELQKQADEANEKGYVGEVPDPTPNENYTVAGVTSGKATPETDAAAFRKAQAQSQALGTRFGSAKDKGGEG